MSVQAESAAANHGRLARDLLARALTAFAAVPDANRGPALAAIDAFLEAPDAAKYLAAARALCAARRAHAVKQVRDAQTGYARVRGLDAVRRELGTAAAEHLAAVPFDERAGHRLRALALLAAAHRELAERVAGSAELLRKQLGLATERTTAVPSSRPRGVRKRMRPPRRRIPR